MKIPCYFKPGPFEAAYVTARLIVRKLRIEGELEFLVDTGASRTIISDRDAIWLGIDYKKLKKAGESIGIGGSVDTYEIPRAILTLLTDAGEPFAFTTSILVMRHKKVDEKVKRIPSILGRDFLNRFTLVYSRKDNRALITDEKLV